MVDPAVKTALGLCILLIGICVAMLFRSERPHPTPDSPSTAQPVLLRYRADAPAKTTRSPAAVRSDLTCQASQESAAAQTVTIVAPSQRREPPPSLSPDYPTSARPTVSHWNMSMEMMLPVARSSPATTHTVVDGDTLPTLAQRYLGSSVRANEIFDANRDVLRDPALLPIGIELKLPSRDR
jgi:nucleoid-associated protein YgaU